MNPGENRGAARRSVGWSSFRVGPAAAAELVASQLLEIARDPRNWSLSSFGATVTRRTLDGHDEFYFSPLGVGIFEGLIRDHSGGPCDPPRTRDLDHSRTSRMLLGFSTRWDKFLPRARPGRTLHHPSRA